ncbi:MAG: glutathione S-transferase family protein [Proteobacteria bacterium]|nr:glutathione S-transferase family protein [Pseudomonadota bacterium]
MKLYYAPQTRAIRPRWLLEELGEPYDLIKLDIAARDQKKPEHLALHPLGKVPVLVDGDVTMIESLAICLYLADKYLDRGLAPPHSAPARPYYYQWCVYSIGTLEPTILATMIARQRGDADAALARVDQGTFGEAVAVIENALANRRYLLGDKFTAADIMVGSIFGWGAGMGLFQPSETIGRYMGTLSGRPAFQKVMAD